MIVDLRKKTAQHQASVSTIFNVFLTKMLSFLLIKYFAVSNCELFSRVQLVTISFAHVSKNVALYYVV